MHHAGLLAVGQSYARWGYQVSRSVSQVNDLADNFGAWPSRARDTNNVKLVRTVCNKITMQFDRNYVLL